MNTNSSHVRAMSGFIPAIFLTMGTLFGSEPSPLQLEQTVPLKNVSGRFDHFAADLAGKRIFVAALGNDTVEVIDLAKGVRVQSIRDLHKPTGLAYLAGAATLYVANGGDGTLRVFDGNAFSLAGQVSSLDDADNVRYDATANRVYLGFGDGAISAVSTGDNVLRSRIELKGHPESFQLEQDGPRIFVNVPDARRIVIVDREKKTVVAEWPIDKFRSNFPMALDEKSHRLFVGCRSPARLLVLDTETGKPVADLEIAGDTDDLFFDAKRQRIYVSCGEGFIDVIQRHDEDHYERIAHVATRPGARTSFFAPERDRLYVAVPRRGGKDAELRVYQPH